jgi:hypothetical protein
MLRRRLPMKARVNMLGVDRLLQPAQFPTQVLWPVKAPLERKSTQGPTGT